MSTLPVLGPLDEAPHAGSERRDLVRQLVETAQASIADRRPRLVSLEGGLGVGKTRLLREFYQALAAEQSFWPPTLGAPDPGPVRHQIDPGPFAVPGDRQPPWLWVLIRCETFAGYPAPAMAEAVAKLHDRGDVLLRGRRRQQAIGRLLSKIARFGLGFVPLGNLTTLGDVLDAVEDVADITEGFGRVLTSPAGGDAAYVVPAGEVTRGQMIDDVAQLLSLLAKEDLPVVLVIDDAHHCEAGVLQLLDRVFARKLEAPLLCVAASVPALGGGMLAPYGWPEWLENLAATDGDAVFRVPVEPLTTDAAEHLLLSLAPGSAAEVVATLAARADGNPLILAGMLADERLAEGFRGQVLQIAPGDVARIPNTYRDHFRDRWGHLPVPARITLSIAALQGRKFDPALLESAAHVVPRAVDGLEHALSSPAWIVDHGFALGFAEQIGFELAIDAVAADGRITPDALHEACLRIARSIVAWKEDTPTWQLRDLASRVLILEVHVQVQRHLRTAELGVVDVVSAIDSAITVGRVRRVRADPMASLDVLRHAVSLGVEVLPDHPVTGAAREQLAATLDGLHRFDEAVQQRRAGLEVRRRALGDRHRLFLEARLGLGDALGGGRRDDEALVEYEAVLGTSLKVFGEHDALTVRARAHVAAALERLSRLEEALDHRVILHAHAEQHDDPDGLLVPAAKEDIARVLLALDRPTAARPLLETAIAQRGRRYGHDDPGALSARDLLGSALREIGDAAGALEQRRIAAAIADDLLEATDLWLLAARTKLAELLQSVDADDADDQWRQATRGWRTLLDEAQRQVDDAPEAVVTTAELRGWVAYCTAHFDVSAAVPLRERSVDELEAALGADHLLTVTAHAVLGSALTSAGRHKQALPCLARAVAWAEARLTAAHPTTIRWRFWWATALAYLKHFERAASILEQAVIDSESVRGPDHPATLELVAALGRARGSSGDYEEAAATLRRVLRRLEQACGPEDERTLAVCQDLGAYLYKQERYAESVPFLARARDGYARTHGPLHVLTSKPAFLSGQALCRIGDRQAAIGPLLQGLAARQANFEADNVLVVTGIAWVGTTLAELGRHEEAIPYFEQTVVNKTARFGADHAETLHTVRDLAASLSETKRSEEALPLARRAAVGFDGLDDAEADAENAYVWSACSLKELGRPEEAAIWFALVARRRTARLGPTHADTALAHNYAAGAFHDAGDLGSAVHHQDLVVAACSETLGEHHQETVSAQATIVGLVSLIRSHDAALEQAQAVFEVLSVSREPGDPLLLDARLALSDVLQAAGRHEAALVHRQSVLRQAEAQFGPSDARTIESRDRVGDTLFHLGKYEDALVCHRRVAQVRGDVLGEGHPATVRAVERIAGDLEGLQQYDEELAVRTKLFSWYGRRPGPPHQAVDQQALRMAEILVALGRHDQALRFLEPAMAALELRHGPAGPLTLGVRMVRAGAFAAEDQTTDARDEYQRVIDALDGADDPDGLSREALRQIAKLPE